MQEGMDMAEGQGPSVVERWDMFEVALQGPAEGNPFVDVVVGARFGYRHRVVHVDGFYDGEGRYRIRFMPDTEGEWRYETFSKIAALNGVRGTFHCVAPREGNHGPVRVHDRFHFRYEDGTPYYPVGTTCYVWNHQGDAMEEQTLATLKTAPFNKMRMCVFPKHYHYNQNEPEYHPFEPDGAGGRDFARFNPAFWRHLEQRVGDLMALGIEADLILFHGYDRWGYSRMSAEADDRYLRYVVARLAAFRNVWWSLANEYDLMTAKTMADWDRFFRIVQESDPYGHLRSVHNCRGFYDHAKPRVTHQSIQHSDVELTRTWREQYGKPVVIDECRYEGNIPLTWGNISGQELVRRFWETTVRGGYCGHGETYLHPEDRLWWSKGGVLRGTSPERIAFLRRLIEGGPAQGLEPVDGVVDTRLPCAAKGDDYYLIYCGIYQPAELPLTLPEGEYAAEVIDTWQMTIEPVGTYRGKVILELPGRPYMAVRLLRVT
jgi:hypothetical protein